MPALQQSLSHLGKYKKGFLKRTLLLSFQFHHTQLDGVPAAQFLSRLQQEIQTIQKASIVPKALRDNRPFRPSLRAFFRLCSKERNRLSSSKIHGGRGAPLSWPHTGPPAQCPLGGYHPVPGRTTAHLKSCPPPQWYPPKDRVLPRRKSSPSVHVPHRPVPPASKQPFCQPGPAAPPFMPAKRVQFLFTGGSAHR